jgi:hypothetical protein
MQDDDVLGRDFVLQATGRDVGQMQEVLPHTAAAVAARQARQGKGSSAALALYKCRSHGCQWKILLSVLQH